MLAILAGACGLASLAAPSLKAESFTWSPESLYNGTHPTSPNPWSTEWVPEADGTKGIKVTIGKGEGFYNYIAIPQERLPGGTDFTAEVSFRVETPTILPKTFYIFARNSKSPAYDLWQRWIGEPGEARTIRFPMQLKPIEGGKWTIYLGTQGAGSLIIDKLVIQQGRGLVLKEPGTGTDESGAKAPAIPLATGSGAITVKVPVEEGATPIDPSGTLVADGATPVTDEVAEANGKALQKLFDKARTLEGPKKILIPKGTYRFALKGGMHLDDVKDLTIDGQDSLFIFQKLYIGQLFLITKCERLAWKNLSLDWNWEYKPIASIGVVKSLSADQKQAAFTFPNLTSADVDRTAKEPWIGLAPIDATTLYRDRQVSRPGFLISKPPTVTANGDELTASFQEPLALEVGASYIVRHHYYELLGFKTGSCRDLTFDHVTIYSLPGMGWLNTGATENWQFLHCRIVRPEGSRRPLTTAADGIHTNESNGNLIIRDCEFTGLGDDAINLHDNSWQGGLKRGDNPNQLVFFNSPKHRLRLEAGDTIRFYKADYSPSGIELKVSAEPKYEGKPNAYSPTTVMTVDFTTPVPENLSSLAVAINTRCQTKNVQITGCRFINLFGRAILYAGDNATIENNIFHNVFNTPIQIQTDIVDNYWGEGHGSSNVVIRNNVFEDPNWANRWEGAVIYTGGRIPWGPTSHPLYQNFLIEKNRFVNVGGPAMAFNFSQNFVVRDNTIEFSTPAPNQSPYAGTISLNLSSNMDISGNKWINRAPLPSPTGVTYDPANCTGISTANNQVENLFK